MPLLAVFTTHKDTSQKLFFASKIQASWVVQIFFYEDFLHGEELPLVDSEARVYLRDPFTSDISSAELYPLLTKIFAHYPKNTFIDNLVSLEDIYLEDKWLQYQRFKKFMPESFLASDMQKNLISPLYKKRISSRSRHIYFEIPEYNQEDYIAQERLNIQEEYRVIAVHKNILPIALIKSTKTNISKVKVIAQKTITNEIKSFVEEIQKAHSFDLVGYDIALTNDNKLYLIELNRSPQILAYQRETGINLFEKLLT